APPNKYYRVRHRARNFSCWPRDFFCFSARASPLGWLRDPIRSRLAMLTSRQSIWRRFWHAVVPLDALQAGPRPFRLLGEDIVLFLDQEGRPAALQDRCRHRTARLSKGWCKDGE